MNDNETIDFESRTYLNPQVSLDEQSQFIDRFKALQQTHQNQIDQQTQALGSQVPSNQGGLVGAEGLWNVQYQRPQVNAAIENLRANNQLQALNTVMQNQQNAIANRLNQAKRAYYTAQQNQYNRDRTSSSSGSGSSTSTSQLGNVNVNELEQGTVSGGDGTITSNAPGTSAVLTPDAVANLGGLPQAGVYDSATGEQLWVSDNPYNGQPTNTGASWWELNNSLTWLLPLLKLPGSQEQVKK